MKQGFLSLLFTLLGITLSAQIFGFSEGKNLAELRSAVYAQGSFHPGIGGGSPQLSKKFKLWEPPAEFAPSSVFLPKWSAEDLPFFCKIEHDWGIRSRIPFKFRLGSVEYVDWLEGK